MSRYLGPGNPVDVENGIVSRAIFADQEIYEQEQEQIFARAWLFVGHESQIPDKDDFYISRMGEESVILTRDGQNRIHVFLNSCTHRGMRLCRYDEGNARIFTCPYHAWSFASDGDLVSTPGELYGVPGYETRYHKALDKKQWGLVAAPQVANHRGTIWATWDPDAPPFDEYLGGMGQWLDFALDYRDGRAEGATVLAGVQKWRVQCNWKFAPTNFIGDVAHVVSHRSVDMVGIGPSGKGRRDARREGASVFGWPKLGHGGTGWQAELEEDYEQPKSFGKFPVVEQYFSDARARRREVRAGELHFQGKGTIFPNMSFHEEQPRTIIVSHPVSPTETEFWRYYLVDEDAPTEVKDTLRRYFMSYSGPAGLTEQDDLENWSEATSATTGVISRRHAFNYQQGLGFSEHYEKVADTIWAGHLYSEQNQLLWMKRWAEFMDAWEWDQLMHRTDKTPEVPMPVAPTGSVIGS